MLQWFKTHPEFLRKESTALSNDSNYKERCQHRDNLFVSQGDIIVRAKETTRFPILIVYTDATPYRLPKVFPLTRNLSDPEVAELAALNIFELFKKIRPDVHYYYHLRHQNSSGELCTLERADLDGASKFYGITSILQRVRDWFAGHVTGNYPPDSEEVDFQSHFNFINDDTKLFYSNQFLDASLWEGDCYASLYKTVPKGLYSNESRRVYSGCFIDGIGKGGLFTPTAVDLSRYNLHEKINNSHDIYIVKSLIANGQLLKAQWFHIDNEPMPFEKLAQLVTIIGNGEYHAGVNRLSRRSMDNFNQLPDSFHLAIRFANRKANYEFQLFKIFRKEGYTFSGLSENDPIRRMQFILDCYEKVEAVESEKMTAQTFHQRNSKRADYSVLKDSVVNIMGVGAIGSEIADSINKAGIGKIVLLDDQTIKVHNAVRHLAGIEFIGESKVEAVHRILYNHNPFVNVLSIPFDLYYLDATQLNDRSVSICSVADDNVEGFINQQLVLTNRPAFYVRALRGGKTARIFRVLPGEDACFHCLSLYRNEGKDFIDIPEDPDYPILMNECNNPIRPASAADLKFIAAMASRLIIEHLQDGPSASNHWIWSSDTIADTPINTSNQLHAQHLPPHDHCPYCHHDTKVTVTIDPSCISQMQTLVRQDATIETGGVMAGKVDDIGNITVTHVSGPGPRALQSAAGFEKDVASCQKFLDEIYMGSNQEVTYVGEWHSHPSADNRPSGTDIKSLSEIAIAKNYLTSCPAMIIFSNTGKPSCTLHPVGKRYYFTNLIMSDSNNR